MRTKKYNKTAQLYAEKLRKIGYTCRFNWISDSEYDDVTVTGAIWRGYGGEWPTPRKAYEYIINYNK